MSRVDVSVCVVSYNCRDLLASCLLSVQNLTAPREIIVLDNASTDGTVEFLRQNFPDVQLIASEQNVGFAGGMNRAAAEASGKYLLLLNPDARLQAGCVEALLATAEAYPGAGIVGGVIRGPDGATDPQSCWGLPTPWSAFCFATGLAYVFSKSKIFNPEALPAFDRRHDKAVPMVSGCLMLIRTEVWSTLGGFDESFFLYGEDADLNRRIGRLGLERRIASGAAIEHVGGASSGSLTSKIEMLYRGKCTYYRKAYRGWVAWACCEALVVGVGLRSALLRPTSRREEALSRAYAGAFRSRAVWRAGW